MTDKPAPPKTEATFHAMGSGIHPNQNGWDGLDEKESGHAKQGHGDTSTFGASTAGLQPMANNVQTGARVKTDGNKSATDSSAGSTGQSAQSSSGGWATDQGEMSPASAGNVPKTK